MSIGSSEGTEKQIGPSVDVSNRIIFIESTGKIFLLVSAFAHQENVKHHVTLIQLNMFITCTQKI
jgi:hypothetical protein